MQVFISHNSADKMDANELFKRLDAIEGVDVWLDMFELNAGDSLDTIDDVLARVDAVVVLWSANADMSQWVRKEIELGQQSGKRIIPCLLDDASLDSNPMLRQRLYLDFKYPQLGLGHLLLSYVLPDALERAGRTEAVRPVRRYEGYVAHCIRDLVVRGRGLDTAGYWRAETAEAMQAVFSLFASMLDEDELDPALRAVLEGAEPHLGGLQEALDEILAGIEAGESDVTAVDVDATIEDFADEHDADATYDDVTAFLAACEIDDPEVADALAGYIDSCFGSLDALAGLADELEVEVLHDVVEALADYLADPDDVLPEAVLGQVGFLDDAWLIHNVAYRVVEAGGAEPDRFGVDWDAIVRTDPIVRELIGADGVDQLETYLLQLVTLLFGALDEYEPSYVYDEDGTARFYIGA